MKDKMEEARRIIKYGNSRQIQTWLMEDFHAIKHTESFALLIDRLRDMEHVIKNIKKIVDEK